jgi:hypothetical protein
VQLGPLLQVLVQNLQKTIKQVGFFGLSFDDSKAIDDSEYMSLEAYWIDPETSNQVSAFLKLKEVQDVDATSLTAKLVSLLDCLINIVDCLDCLLDFGLWRRLLTCYQCIDNLDHEIYLHNIVSSLHGKIAAGGCGGDFGNETSRPSQAFGGGGK